MHKDPDDPWRSGECPCADGHPNDPWRRTAKLSKQSSFQKVDLSECKASLTNFTGKFDLIVRWINETKDGMVPNSEALFFANQDLMYAIRSWQKHRLISQDEQNSVGQVCVL